MAKVFKVGLIGCGHIAETYFRAHKYFNNFKIIKCADINNEAAKKCAKRYNIEDRIFFIDSVPYEQLAAFSENAYIGLSLIQPISKSYEHALPNKLFEYAIRGLPIICSDLPAMKDMILKHKVGIAIQWSNTDEF